MDPSANSYSYLFDDKLEGHISWFDTPWILIHGAAFVTAAFLAPAGGAALVFASLWVSIALTKYVVDEANS